MVHYIKLLFLVKNENIVVFAGRQEQDPSCRCLCITCVFWAIPTVGLDVSPIAATTAAAVVFRCRIIFRTVGH